MKVYRYPENPIITQRDVKPAVDGWEVMSAFNAGVTEYNGEVLLLMRVAERPMPDGDMVLVPIMDFEEGTAHLKVLEFNAEDEGIDLTDPRVITFPGRLYLTSISHLRLARSRDGRHFTVEDKPALYPDQPYESYGLEDPRITKLDDTYYVVYKGVSPTGITQCLASTKDFINWKKHGIILAPENMDGMLFPEKIRGKYALLHRPQPKMLGTPNMWAAYSDNLIYWGEHKYMIGCP